VLQLPCFLEWPEMKLSASRLLQISLCLILSRIASGVDEICDLEEFTTKTSFEPDASGSLCVQDPRFWEWKTSLQTEDSVIEHIESECQLNTPEVIGVCRVPRNIHLVWYNGSAFRFDHYVALKSMFVTIIPDNIFVHGREFPSNNIHFDRCVDEFDLKLVQSRAVEKVHNQSVDVIEHKSDVVRIETLIRFGGMYFDFDVLLLRPVFHFYENEETVLGPQNSNGLNCGIIFAKRCSIFMRRWYHSFKDMNDTIWDHHCVTVPHQLMMQDSAGVTSDGVRIKTNFLESGDFLFSTDTTPSFWSHAAIIHSFIKFYSQYMMDEGTTISLQNNYGHIVRNILSGKPGLATEL
jgi:hypothetical protein